MLTAVLRTESLTPPDSTTHIHREITIAFEANYTTETTEVVTFIETPYSVTKEPKTFIRYKWNTVETKEETTTTTTYLPELEYVT